MPLRARPGLLAVAGPPHLVGRLAPALVGSPAQGVRFLARRAGGRLIDGDRVAAHSRRLEVLLVRRGVARLAQLPPKVLGPGIAPGGHELARGATAPEQNRADRSPRESR
jgi:hypothetical protein